MRIEINAKRHISFVCEDEETSLINEYNRLWIRIKILKNKIDKIQLEKIKFRNDKNNYDNKLISLKEELLKK